MRCLILRHDKPSFFTVMPKNEASFNQLECKSDFPGYGDTRAVLLDTFSYMIHFAIDEQAKKVVISAILSTPRNPKIWEER
jgi:hypothetical protein